MNNRMMDGGQRGFPADRPAIAPEDLASAGLDPRDGTAQLPVMTFDEAAWERNCDAMFAYLRAVDAEIAPHAKTPMSPELCHDLMARGASAMTVADIRQAAVLLQHGIKRLVLANQIGGKASGARLGRILAQDPEAEVTLYVDSLAALETAASVAEAAGRPMEFLIEVGGGRAGARDTSIVHEILARLDALPLLKVAGVAAYEGASATADAAETRNAIRDLHAFAAEAFALLRQRLPDARLTLSSGGSGFFDLVVEDLGPLVKADGNARLLLRSGAIFFHDHGVYARGLANMDRRGAFLVAGIGPASEAFEPALLVYAEVLSRPEPGLAICGMGMRDVSFDQGLPVAVAQYREGQPMALAADAKVARLNDQHCFLAIDAAADLAVGDVLAFGISHPCTALDRWSWIFRTRADGRIIGALPTYFG